MLCVWIIEHIRQGQQFKMADLEAVLADVSYLMAMEKSRSQPAARASKKIILPDPRYVFTSISEDRWSRGKFVKFC